MIERCSVFPRSIRFDFWLCAVCCGDERSHDATTQPSRIDVLVDSIEKSNDRCAGYNRHSYWLVDAAKSHSLSVHKMRHKVFHPDHQRSKIFYSQQQQNMNHILSSCPWCWVNPSNHHPRCKEKHTRIIYATVQTNKKSSVERLTPSNDVTWAYVRRTSTSQCEGAHDAFSESHNICMTWGRSMKKRYIM